MHGDRRPDAKPEATLSIAALLRWQWDGYPRYHRSRTNLLVHIVAVPAFVLGNITFVVGLIQQSWMVASIALLSTVVSVAAQGQGHREEAIPPEPFSSGLNAVARIILEQWVTFPRFVFSGGWLNALREASPQ